MFLFHSSGDLSGDLVSGVKNRIKKKTNESVIVEMRYEMNKYVWDFSSHMG